MGNWHIAEVPSLRGFAVEWYDSSGIYLSRRNQLFYTPSEQESPRYFGAVPAGSIKSLVARFRLGQRFLRFMVYNLIPTAPEEFLITFDRQIGVMRAGQYIPLKGIRKPARILRQGIVKGKDGKVYWGEYIPNKERKEIVVYCYQPGSDYADVVHTFPPGFLRHVHGIYRDPFGKEGQKLWCLSGDRPEECKFQSTADGFKSLKTVWEGDETWRAVSAQFTPRGIYYGSDAEFRDNFLYHIDRASGEREVMCKIDGPVYYSKVVRENIFFATTAEMCPSQLENVASLWHVNSQRKVTKVFSAYKDLIRKDKRYRKKPLSAFLFNHGTLHFPGGPRDMDQTYISCVGLKGYDNRVLRLYQGK